MNFSYIWARNIFKELLKFVLLFIIAFAFLYLLIDYSINGKNFSKVQFSFLDISFYYLSQMSYLIQILLPFALLLATIKVLIHLNKTRELLILYSSGLSSKQIIKPFLIISFVALSFLYLNAEYFSPLSKRNLRKIEETFFANKSIDLSERYINTLEINDGSYLIYQYFDPDKGAFFDVFWVQHGGDEITKIKYLYPESIPRGLVVDFIKKDKNERLLKQSSSDEALFPKLLLDQTVIDEAKFNPSESSMFDLIKQYKKIKNADQKIEIKTDLAMRLFMPLLSLLSVMLPAPFCLKYSRNIPIFMIYSIFIFGFICLITLCNGIYIVANNGVTSPFLCLSLLFTPLFIYTIWKHISLNKL